MSAIIAAVATAVVGSAVAAKSASDKRKAINKGAKSQLEENARQYDQTREDFAPWREAGVNALNQLENPLANFYESPDYQYRMTSGLKDLGQAWNVKGGGGNSMRGLEAFRSNLAAGEFNNWFNRLFMQSEAGRGANTSMAALNQQQSNNAINTYGWQADNKAAIAGEKWQGINDALQSGLSTYLWGSGRLGGTTGGSSGVGKSDRRLKKDIVFIGMYAGQKIYRWAWNALAKSLGVSDPTIGVIAQEVPSEFVVTDKDGYLMVDYGRLFGGK